MEILKVLERKLRYKRYAESTILTYSNYVRLFIIEQGIKDPYQVTTKQIIDYLENKNYSSATQQTQIISSLKIFAKYILNKKEIHLSKIERPRRTKKIQPVIPRAEILQKIPLIKNIKHRVIISLGYGCGLRVSELINLQWKHIDRKQGILKVINGKGSKDRIVPISEDCINLLKDYYREYKPKQYVLNGQDWRPQYSPGSCNNIVKSVFGFQYRFHSLRKSAGVHLYDLGNDLTRIQDFYGHNSEKTTRIYVSGSVESIKKLSVLV